MVREAIWQRQEKGMFGYDGACWMHRTGRYVLQHTVRLSCGSLVGFWYLYRLHPIPEHIDLFTSYGRIRKSPPTTWANKRIKELMTNQRSEVR